MKNRNKRFTSVLAASMALGMMAPAFASVAPVFAAPVTDPYTVMNAYNVGSTYYGSFYDENGFMYYVYNDPDAPVAVGTNIPTVAVLVDGTGYEKSSLTLGPTVNLKSGDEQYYSTLVGIGEDSLQGATKLESLTIVGTASNPIIIGKGAFWNDNALRNVTLENVETVGWGAFQSSTSGNGNIRNVTFVGNKLKTIEKYAFQNQPGLTTIELPSSLKTIGYQAFAGTGLTGEINIPDSVSKIGVGAFETSASQLYIGWPLENGKDKDITITDVNGDPLSGTPSPTQDIFGNDTNINYYRILVNNPAKAPNTTLGNTTTGTWQHAIQAPNITSAVSGYRPSTNKNIKAVLGTTVTFYTQGAGTLYIDDEAVDTYVTTTGNKYKWVTPQIGTYTVKFVTKEGFSRSINVQVVTEGENYWLNANITMPAQWVLGTDENPSGAEAKYGDVYYVYSSSLHGNYTTAKPNYVGTWFVKAVVDETSAYRGLSTDALEFKVYAPSAINTGWVASGDNWMYKEDGEFVTSALKEIDGDTYLFDDEGIMVTGWAKNDNTNGKWMFFDNAGHAKKGWLNDNGTWYFLDSNAVMVANEWVKDAGKDYFLTDNGAMAVSRWLTKDGHDVYVDNSGALKTGWLAWNMNWYYLEPSTGYMATSGTVDGWNIQSNGIAVKA